MAIINAANQEYSRGRFCGNAIIADATRLQRGLAPFEEPPPYGVDEAEGTQRFQKLRFASGERPAPTEAKLRPGPPCGP